MSPEPAWPVVRIQPGRRKLQPDRLDDRAVAFSELGHAERSSGTPVARIDGLRVHPLGSVRVPLNLEVLAQFLVTDGATFFEQELHLLQDEGIALERRRVVYLLEPDSLPDLLRLGRFRQPAYRREIRCRAVERSEHGVATRTSAGTRLVAHSTECSQGK